MQKMVANRKFVYRSRDVLPDEEFDVDDEHVSVLTTIGHAHVPSIQVTTRRVQRYKTRVMRPSRA